jgi:hypothetical protein
MFFILMLNDMLFIQGVLSNINQLQNINTGWCFIDTTLSLLITPLSHLEY